MLRRRRSRATRDAVSQDNSIANPASPIAKAINPVVQRSRQMMEMLEPRRYLLAVFGSGDFEYKDDSGGFVRVVYENITAEFVFIDVVESAGTMGSRPLPEGYTRLTQPHQSVEGEGRDLFHIYIAESSHESRLSIARVPTPGQGAGPRPMQPFGGGVSFTAQNAQGGEPVTAQVGPGDVLIGGLTHSQVEDFDERPIITHRFRGLAGGILGPKANEKLTAGITIEEGQSFGRMFIGGTIFGEVTAGGSIDTFYAGGLATGHADGASEGSVINPDNFTVRGDLRNLIVGGSIGMDLLAEVDEPGYVSGFDLNVTGSVDMVRAGGLIGGSFDVHNSGSISKIRFRQRELERRFFGDRGQFTDFENFELGDAFGLFNNDTFDTPQILGTYNSRDLGENSIQINGELQLTPQIGDFADYYGVGMMAGQTMTVRLLSPFDSEIPFIDPDTGREFMELNVGVFDPDGRLIATDFSNTAIGISETEGAPFSFKAERPGLYRIAVAGDNNGDFLEGGEFGGVLPGETPYHLQITNIANGIKGGIGLGGVFADGIIFDHAFGFFSNDPDFEPFETPNGIRVRRGDLGAIISNSNYIGNGTNNIVVDKANLRTVVATSIGKVVGDASQDVSEDGAVAEAPDVSISVPIDLSVPGGSVGLIRTTDPSGLMWLNGIDPIGRFQIESPGFDPETDFLFGPRTVGFDYQTIDAAGMLTGNIVADRRIGTIRAQNMAAPLIPIIAANDDNVGNDGRIDLIDVAANLGRGSGPQLSTGDGGNIRYIRVGGTAFRDSLFGGGSPQQTLFGLGEEVNLVDDSGAQLTLTPIPITRRFDPTTGESLLINPGRLSVLTLPVRRARGDESGITPGGGGSVVLEVTTTRGLEVISSGTGGGNAEIGKIIATGTGTGIVNNSRNTISGLDDRLTFAPSTTTAASSPLEIDISGSAAVDVLEITFEEDADTGIEGQFTRISNTTDGELVSIHARSIGFLEANTIGLTDRRSTPAEVNPIDAFDTPTGENDVFPWNDQRYGVSILESAIDIEARRGLGNIWAGDIIQNVVANSDGNFEAGVFEGINAPIYTVGSTRVRLNTAATRALRFVNIGEGILPSGTGNLSRAGLYSNAVIGRIVNQGSGSDIRGDIVSEAGIDTIELTDGSIINADIMLITEDDADLGGDRNGNAFLGSREMPQGLLVPNLEDSISNPRFELNEIIVGGEGGIIGAFIVGDDVGTISVLEGFGIISTEIGTLGDGVFNPITVDGYGIRSSEFSGGAVLRGLAVGGKGNRLDTRQFEGSVRTSERAKVDPFFGTVPNKLTDLHKFLGTTAAAPIRKGRSNAGSIEDSTFSASRDLGFVHANQIKKSAFNFGNRINQMIVQDVVDLIEVTTGGFDHLTIGKDSRDMDITVAGPVGDVNVKGNFLGSSRFRATGPNGTINSFSVGKSLYGILQATVDINTVTVGGDLGSAGVEGPPSFAGIDVGRNLRRLDIKGSVLSTASVEIAEDLTALIVGGDVEDGAVIRAGSIGSQDIDGDVFGSVVITG